VQRKQYGYLTYTERLKIEALSRSGVPAKEIAHQLNRHISTIYRELKRGRYNRLEYDYTYSDCYSADIAHDKYRQNIKAKGPAVKLGHNYNLASYITQKIMAEKYSPAAVLASLRQPQTPISVSTLYSYIHKGILFPLSADHLPMRGKRNPRSPAHRRPARPPIGQSIEKRPEPIKTRQRFGNWEMDTVVGKVGGSRSALLVLTERKTRFELIRKMPDKKAQSVIKEINKLERLFGAKFGKVFQTITVDNGSEFSNCEKMQVSPYTRKPRTTFYYCHPYSSYERGSNEQANGMIRRFIQKGSDMANYGNADIAYIENWLNNYPRKVLGWRTAKELFDMELSLL
jgi:IS30 family transposase